MCADIQGTPAHLYVGGPWGHLYLVPRSAGQVVCVCACVPQAAMVGSGGRRIMNTANACGICGNEMQDYSHLGEEVSCCV